MKIGTLTFHSAYNFGSNLQAFALQEYVLKLANEYNKKVDYSVINLRTNAQSNIYDYKRGNIAKKIIKQFFYGRVLDERSARFESFINNYLNVTKKYNTREEIIRDNIKYDICITGSDQIWNLAAYDFDWSYFLEDISCKRKILYAVSSGPKETQIAKSDKEKITGLINKYDYISVREEGTKDFVEQFTDKNVSVNMDPTLLLTKDEWNKIIDEKPIIDEPYILYYSLRPSKSRTKYLKQLSKMMNMKVVVANPAFKYYAHSGFIKKYNSGPLEFLNLLKNAKLVISSSFHGTIFSVILNVPFYALNGKNDYRISTLLKTMRLEERAIDENENLDSVIKNAFNIDFENANKIIKKEREKSRKYLTTALGMGDNNE